MSDMLGTTSWVNEIRDLYSEGAGDAEVAVAIGTTIKDFHRMYETNSKFAALIDLGRTLSQAWWEKQARYHVGDKSFNTPLWIFYMKNKHAWAEKTESVNVNDIPLDADALRQELFDALAKFQDRHAPELTDARKVLTLRAADAGS